MERRYVLMGCLGVWVMGTLLVGPRVYADETSRINDKILAIQADRANVESQLMIKDTYRPVSLFYAGVLGHYELQQQAVANAVNEVIRFYAQIIKPIQIDRVHVFSQLKIDLKDAYPHASSYYDDLADHFEQDQLMEDVLAEGIR